MFSLLLASFCFSQILNLLFLFLASKSSYLSLLREYIKMLTIVVSSNITKENSTFNLFYLYFMNILYFCNEYVFLFLNFKIKNAEMNEIMK